VKDWQPTPSLEVTQWVVGCFVAGMDSFRKGVGGTIPGAAIFARRWDVEGRGNYLFAPGRRCSKRFRWNEFPPKGELCGKMSV